MQCLTLSAARRDAVDPPQNQEKDQEPGDDGKKADCNGCKRLNIFKKLRIYERKVRLSCHWALVQPLA